MLLKKYFVKFSVLICLIYSRDVLAGNYYVDPSASSALANGSIEHPFTSIEMVNDRMKKFVAGDTIFFKRNELFFDKLLITCSGSKSAPVVFMPYGDKTQRPAFLFNKGGDVKMDMFEIRNSRYVVIDGFHISDDKLALMDEWAEARIKHAFFINESEYISIINCDISFVGIGINILGNNNRVHQCHFKKLRMVRNTEGGDDDYGANPVVIAGSGNEVSGCRFIDCWARSYDYEFDGGAIDMFGPNCHNNIISNNFAFQCNGFIEFGSAEGGESTNNLLERNTIINCGDLLYINTGQNFGLQVKKLVLKNNVILQGISQLTRPKFMISMTTKANHDDILSLQGNIFWLSIPVHVVRENIFTSTQLLHQRNIYYLEGGKLHFNPDPTEKIYGADTGDWVKTPMGEIIKSNPALYPFKYLIPYWALFF